VLLRAGAPTSGSRATSRARAASLPLHNPGSIYRPGIRSPAWLKVKPKVTLEVVVTGGSSKPILWGDWGLAVMLEISYKHPRDEKLVEIRQAIRIRRDEPFTLRTGKRAELVDTRSLPGYFRMGNHPSTSRIRWGIRPSRSPWTSTAI
jgi:hypothetical protein